MMPGLRWDDSPLALPMTRLGAGMIRRWCCDYVPLARAPRLIAPSLLSAKGASHDSLGF